MSILTQMSLPDKINLFSAVGAWLGAAGTILAVVVALFLARRDSKIRLAVSAGHRLIVTPGSGNMPDFCNIRVVNVGFRKATITGVGWSIGLFGAGAFKRQLAVQIFDASYSSKIPVILADGEEASWMLPFKSNGQGVDWLEYFAEGFVGTTHPRILAHTLRVEISTSVGANFRCKVEKGLRDKLIEEALRIKEQKEKRGTAY